MASKSGKLHWCEEPYETVLMVLRVVQAQAGPLSTPTVPPGQAYSTAQPP